MAKRKSTNNNLQRIKFVRLTEHQSFSPGTSLVVIATDCTGGCKSNYHIISTTMAPLLHCMSWQYLLFERNKVPGEKDWCSVSLTNLILCRLLFVLFLLAIVLSVLLRFMDYDYPFGNLIQHYVIKFVSHLGQVCGFLKSSFSSTNKTDHHDITEIL
jgi:hypothetical protein